MKIIESALNKTMLLEKEKEEYYFAFETKELLKGKMNGSKGSGITRLNKGEYDMVMHEMATNHPDIPEGFVGKFPIRNHMYKIMVAAFGSYGIISKRN